MRLLERYLLQVEKYLPLKDRKDTTLELKNLLLEDIAQRVDDGQQIEDATYEVIKDFGDPKKVALSYRNDNAIISREMEPILYLVLKVVIIAVPSSILLASIIAFLNNGLPFDFADFLLTILYAIPNMFSGALTSVGSVFIIFALMEKFLQPQILEELEKQEKEQAEFDPLRLPKVPESIFRVSIIESTIAIIGGIVFLYIFNYQPGIIAVYFDGNKYRLLTENFDKILPIINISIGLGIIIEAIHLINRNKSLTTAILEFINKIITSIIFILLATSSVLNQVVIVEFHLEVLSTMFIIGMYLGATANIIVGVIKFINVYIASKKNHSKELE